MVEADREIMMLPRDRSAHRDSRSRAIVTAVAPGVSYTRWRSGSFPL